MNPLTILRSRTVWMFIALVIINGVTSVREMIPANMLPYIDILLGMAGTYFRARPKANI